VIWDGGRSEARVALHPEYKRTVRREHVKERFEADDIWENIEGTQRLLRYLGIPQVKLYGVEADDLICMLADKMDDVVIVSTDKDFYQLIDRNISVFDPMKAVLITEKNFSQVVGLPLTPAEYLEYHILLGDRSDNIPRGVPGLGPKTALSLIQAFKSVKAARDNVKINVDDYPKKVKGIITPEAKAQLAINRELIYLRRFAKNISFEGGNLLDGSPKTDYKKFETTIGKKRYGFRSILKEFNYWVLPFRKLAIRRRKSGTVCFSIFKGRGA
jgi:DNA polymerase-1